MIKNRGFVAFLLFALSANAQDSTEGWFEFRPANYFAEGTLDMSHWLDAPAGKHGFLQYKGKDFVFEDGTPVKFWGVNIASNKPFSDAETSRKWTRMLAKYGVNGVRFHKFTWEATDGIHSTEITTDNWEKFDFFCNELRQAGIYYSWSHIYGHRLMPADSARVLAYEEVRDTKFPWAHLNGTTASLVNFSDDLQAINVELTVNMLNHTNPHTGKRYAEDPALNFIELQNEDNIFWGAIEETLKQTPAYRTLLCRKFSLWLKGKYGSQEKLNQAWNNKGLSSGETLAKENIYPNPSHSLFSQEYEQAVKENRPVPPHVADRAAFLYEEQLKFYHKFIAAIRETGYKGVIVGSCWQAGSGITHFYNLHTDYIAGPIDRHNYSGGATGHRLEPGKVNNQPMVSKPGSGLLSTGMQQVMDRPFQISEWMALIPNEWTVESSPLIAAYGMGLQGWDASYAFAMDQPQFTPAIQQGRGVYNIASPTQLALYPALAAMIYRNDVREGEVIANRNVNIEDLKNGKLAFVEKVSQQYDVKSFTSSVPVEALAVGRVTVSFDKPKLSSTADLSQYWDRNKRLLISATGQLQWAYSEKGFFTINTAGTQGMVGFAPSGQVDLSDVSLQTSNEFGVILLSSLDKEKGITGSNRLLITTIARARNTGMLYNLDKTELLATGEAPILLEPVKVAMSLKGSRNPTVYVLDHVGNRTGRQVPVKNGKMILDGAEYKTIYYEIAF